MNKWDEELKMRIEKIIKPKKSKMFPQGVETLMISNIIIADRKHQRENFLVKEQILQKLSERDSLQKFREKITRELTFTMLSTYKGTKPAKYEKIKDSLATPTFRAVVDALASSLVFLMTGKLVDEVLDVIEKGEE